MKRPILIATLGFIIGIIRGLYINIVPFILFIILFYLLYSIFKNKYKRLIKIIITKNVVILFCISFLIGNIYILHLEKEYDQIYYSLQKVNVIGTIVSEKEEKDYNNVYKIKVEEINSEKVNNKKFILSINKQQNDSKYIKYGDKLYFEGEYIKPEGKRNYKGFNYSEYLKTQKIYGTFKVNKSIKIIKQNNLNFISLISNKIKNRIIKNVNNIFPLETRGVFLGILLGEDYFISEDIQQNFSDSSLSHLLAVSGAHVSYIVLGLALFFKILKIPKKTNKILTCLFLIFYLYIINFTASATRAVIMSIIGIMQTVFYRKQDIATTISFSSLLILIENPYKIQDIGFLLSYAGTIGIIIFVDKLISSNKQNNSIKITESLKKLCSVTISAQILILPIMAYYFNTISFTFIISNLIASILIGPITILGLIIIILSFISIQLTSIIVKFYNILLLILLNTTKVISKISISKIYVPTPNIISIIIYYIVILILISILKIEKSDRYFLKKKVKSDINKLNFIIKEYKKRILVICLVVSIIFFIFCKIPQNLKINFIDVGQGDCCLIITPLNKKILIDGGGNENYNVGKNTVLPYLLDRGVTSIDYVIISHFDTDHVGGILYLLKEIEVKEIIIGKQFEKSKNLNEFTKIISKKKIKVHIVENKERINIEQNLYFDVFWPDTSQAITKNSINNNAIVCKLNSNKFSMLFTGDIEEETEKILIAEYKNKNLLKSTILKVGHHGSKTSSTQEFLELVSPKIALIGVGKNNKFGHPNNEVLERLKNLNCKIYRTDERGEINIAISKQGNVKIKSLISN